MAGNNQNGFWLTGDTQVGALHGLTSSSNLFGSTGLVAHNGPVGLRWDGQVAEAAITPIPGMVYATWIKFES